MNKKDEVVFGMLSKHVRNPYPDKIIWEQCNDVLKKDFYWLSVPEGSLKKGSIIEAEIIGRNSISIKSKDVSAIIIRLNNLFVDLDKTITINFNGRVVYQSTVKKDDALVQETCKERCDPFMIFAA